MPIENKHPRPSPMLATYAVCTTVLLAAVTLLAATSDRRAVYDEIDVERINVRKPDGRLSLVISNEARMPGVILGDREFGPPKGRSGLVFYDGAGDEMGGLTYGTRTEGGVLTHSGHLAFDARGGDQALDLAYSETWEGGERTGRTSGLRLIDRAASTPAERRARFEAVERGDAAGASGGQYGVDWANRLVIGTVDGTTYLGLNDARARERIRAVVGAEGAPRVEVLDAEGSVVHVIALEE